MSICAFDFLFLAVLGLASAVVGFLLPASSQTALICAFGISAAIIGTLCAVKEWRA